MEQQNDILGKSASAYSPDYYTQPYRGVETIEILEGVIDGLDSKSGYLLGNIIKYTLRAGLKGPAAADIAKANNYAFRLVTGKWRNAQ